MQYAFRYGPLPEGQGRTRFRLWAPSVDRVTLQIEGTDDRVMLCNEDGWHEGAAECGAGARYKFRIGDVSVPDPASRMQDQDVHDWSVVTDCSCYEWQHTAWSGRPWEETVLYELHAGLLGGFTGVRSHLERFAALGVTAIELMPIADFPGERNWGYDGVLPFAPDRAYGTPDELKAFIDTAHGVGLMVFLDVVYNHFGPDGNYLPLYAPLFFDESKHTPWGAAINFRHPEVRRFFIENAIYWLTEFRFDGLRFDAVHAICDKTFLPELAREARDAVGPARHVHLVVENDHNDSELLRNEFDAQWNDDLHHVLHVLLTGEHRGYYGDYVSDPAAKLAQGLSDGFVYQGDPSPFRDGEPRGTSTRGLSPTAFVLFLQNHDQIGNRAFGERLTVLTDAETLEAAIALQLLAPQVPLIFTGEETGAREPFFYFTDHRDPTLAEAVREGRRREFTKFPEFADEQKRSQIPDPNAFETFQRSVPNLKANAITARYAELLQVRQQHLFARLRGVVSEGAQAIGPGAVSAHWRLGDGARLTIACNLGKGAVTAPFPDAEPLWGEWSGGNLAPSTTVVWIEP
ncbi:MAG: malto-oligosyltrehalose trehalohydrolase [Alphaproteobacteria bacterium]